MKHKKNVLVGMSGGVDSAVSAKLLIDRGYDVTGLFIKMTSRQNINQKKTQNICKKLGIKLIICDVSHNFKKEVIDHFVSEYEQGRTPNPCVVCNPKIKFKTLLRLAKKHNFDNVATGHYVRIKKVGKDTDTNYHFELMEGVDENKDQSYFLYNLGKDDLKRIIFPLGDYKKDEVKEIAKKYKLISKNESESQDICFIKDNNIRNFLNKSAKKLKKNGDVVDRGGVKIAEHEGLICYTVGQRSGLSKINLEKSRLKKSKDMIPQLYVLKLNVEKNELVLGLNRDLYQNWLTVEKINWINPLSIGNVFLASAKIRSCSKKAKCRITCVENGINVYFFEKQRAISCGQSIVFYNNKKVLGGGIIK